MDEYAVDLDRSYPIWDVLHESMGFGKPDGHVPARIASGKVNHDWETVVRYLAEVLGIELDGVELDWETLLAPADLPTAVGVIPSGTICGHRWQLSGVVNDRQVVAVQYFATVSSTPWPESWPKPSREGQGGMVFRVEGDPSMSLELYFEQSTADRVNPGITATAMAAVNAIPGVVDAPPGVIEVPLAGPAIVSRLSRTSAGDAFRPAARRPAPWLVLGPGSAELRTRAWCRSAGPTGRRRCGRRDGMGARGDRRDRQARIVPRQRTSSWSGTRSRVCACPSSRHCVQYAGWCSSLPCCPCPGSRSSTTRGESRAITFPAPQRRATAPSGLTWESVRGLLSRLPGSPGASGFSTSSGTNPSRCSPNDVRSIAGRTCPRLTC